MVGVGNKAQRSLWFRWRHYFLSYRNRRRRLNLHVPAVDFLNINVETPKHNIDLK